MNLLDYRNPYWSQMGNVICSYLIRVVFQDYTSIQGCIFFCYELLHMWLRMGCKTKMEFKPGPLFQASMWTQFKQYSNLQNLIPLLHHCSSSSTQSHQDHTGPPRTNQDQSYMILAFPNPHTISKTPPTCVRSDPWILEPLGPQRITQDQPGPVLHDPCLS